MVVSARLPHEKGALVRWSDQSLTGYPRLRQGVKGPAPTQGLANGPAARS